MIEMIMIQNILNITFHNITYIINNVLYIRPITNYKINNLEIGFIHIFLIA